MSQADPDALDDHEAPLETIDQAGKLLLRQRPCFERLLCDMAISADFFNPAFARAGCVQASDPCATGHPTLEG